LEVSAGRHDLAINSNKCIFRKGPPACSSDSFEHVCLTGRIERGGEAGLFFARAYPQGRFGASVEQGDDLRVDQIDLAA